MKGYRKTGNALPLKGYIGEYLSIPNNRPLNPDTFSVSFWIKQDSVFGLDGNVLSRVNLDKTAGWFFEAKIKPEPQIQFSVVNSEGTIFTVAAPINKNRFENVVGSFDGSFIRLPSMVFWLTALIFLGPTNQTLQLH